MQETKATHTPGPWYEMTKGRNEYQAAICQEPTGNTIALTYTHNDMDAKLIAAAPELLEQLILAHRMLLQTDMRNEQEWMGTITQAIAKAKGA